MDPFLNAVAACATLPSAIIEVGAIRLNVESKTVEVNGQRVHLTSMEYELLERLTLRKGVTLSREMILNHLYGGMDRVPEFKIINVLVCKLRRKLRAATGGPHYIETVWGRGYMLRDPAEQSS
jgi:two-component system, cell cycle response regulator CtrA